MLNNYGQIIYIRIIIFLWKMFIKIFINLIEYNLNIISLKFIHKISIICQFYLILIVAYNFLFDSIILIKNCTDLFS